MDIRMFFCTFVDKRRTCFFVWDWANIEKCGKHGVGMEEIEYVLRSDPIIAPDPYPDENRMRAIGQNDTGSYS